MADYLFSGANLLLSSNSGFSAIVCGNSTYTGLSAAGNFSATGTFSPSPITVASTTPSTAYGSITKRYDNYGTMRPGGIPFSSACCVVESRWREISPNYLKKMVELSGLYANTYVTISASATAYNLQAGDLYPWGFSARLGTQTYTANLRFLSTASAVSPIAITNIGPYLQYNSDTDSASAMLEIFVKKPNTASQNAYAEFDFSFGMSGISYQEAP